VALILGSGLGDLGDEIDTTTRMPFVDIPNFPVPSVAGHAGTLDFGYLQSTPVVIMRGRAHYYEGYALQAITLPVRVMRRVGAEILVVTNAAGGLNDSFAAGDLMLLSDHLNIMAMAGHSPLVGPDDPDLGVRFLDMQSPYDPHLRALAHAAAAAHGFKLHDGVYAGVGGPAYETPAEIRFLQRGGADAVGMSTVSEVIVARHERMRVLGLSAITNVAAGPATGAETTHDEVLAAGERVRPRLAAVIRGVLASLTND
jgi:purine-nucleoside phosphorylase